MVLKKVFIVLVCISMLLGFVYITTQRIQAYGSSNASNASHASIVTNVKHFYPLGARDTPALSGNCWETSLAAPRPDAWRCIVTDTIYDPCFSSSSYKNYVICNTAPAGDMRGIKVLLTDSLPVSTATSADHQPWTLRLSDGNICTFLTGATPIIDNQRVNYGCTNDAVIPGTPTEGLVWTVNEKLPYLSTVVTRQVIDAWT
jgi:hypothetical protein